MTSAVIYCRVSTKVQATSGLSLKSQLKGCREKCEANGWRVRGIYIERGKSGRSMKSRPKLAKALKRVCQTKGVLVVYSLSRLARSIPDAHAISEQIQACGASMASVSDGIDTSSAMGRAFYGILRVFARMESDIIGERVKAANDYSIATKGYRTQGRQPAGYRYDKATGERTICESEQAIIAKVREVFKANHKNYNRTAKALEEMGQITIQEHRTQRKATWHRETVKRLLAATTPQRGGQK